MLNSSQAYFETSAVRLSPFSNLSISTEDDRSLLSINSSLVMAQVAAMKLNHMTATQVITKQVKSQCASSVVNIIQYDYLYWV